MSGQSSHAHSSDHYPPHDYSGANRDYFDENAAKLDRHSELARMAAAWVRKTYPDLFNEDETVLLDFACGTGLLSRELCPHVKAIVGVDVSSASIAQYNVRASNQGLLPEEMHAVCAELRGTAGELDGRRFDLVVCAASYHHLENVAETTRTLAFFLKPGGSLLVIDILQDESRSDLFPAQYHHIVAHPHGFAEAEMRSLFEGADLTQFEFAPTVSAKMAGKDLQLFLARGVKPAIV
ncbi:S-adenosyl-L-methionine-dependent methyltransferase [Amylocystis lapponica]|nr:S-adenosyl-L-methionine-dependent methyltransferase [Amylocystis lapponica]